MSQLTTQTQDLLSLAAELNIDLQEGDFASEGMESKYTPFPTPEGARKAFDLYKTGVYKWNIPGQEKAFEETLYQRVDENGKPEGEFENISEVGGIIVDYRQQDSLGYYNSADDKKTWCSVVGHKSPTEGLIKELPNVPYSNKFSWNQKKAGEQKATLNRFKPDPMVIATGIVGSKGMSCEECIKKGEAFRDYEGLDDNKQKAIKTAECEPRGELYLAVYEVTKIKTKPNPVKGGDPIEEKISKKITDLYDADGVRFTQPFILVIPLSKALIRGAWSKVEAECIIGYDNYIKNLKRKFPNDPSSNVGFHFSTLRLRKKDAKSNGSQIHFESSGIAPIEEIKTAIALWNSVKPIRSAVSLDMSSFVPSMEERTGAIEVKARPVNEAMPYDELDADAGDDIFG